MFGEHGEKLENHEAESRVYTSFSSACSPNVPSEFVTPVNP